MTLERRFDSFVQELNLPLLAREVAARGEGELQDPVEFLQTYVNEARVALVMVEAWLCKDMRILEVGAGLCICSLFLKHEGYEVSALEPAAGGFELFQVAKALVLEQMPELELTVHEVQAQQLADFPKNSYDFIFSNNVIEHIPDLDIALDGMLHTLDKTGTMVHGCPNYLVPYEPHLRIPVFKPFPALCEYVFAQRVAQHSSVWASLNFVTYLEIARYAKSRRLEVRFERGLLHRAFQRLEQDSVFRERQKGTALGAISSFLAITRLIHLLKHLPPALATPMVFELSKNGRKT